ncbi:MAG: GNAT family N-acetyltransferase, partial [Rikenellaceae bacterium]|nr:GNAT family N-acetyltransferase [Rikenellaceae bacterium]
MKLQIETKRLLLRGWRRDDLVPFIRMNKDPRVMEHFHRKPDKAEIVDLFTRIRDEMDMFGFGLFAVERLDTGHFIGFVGLHRFDLGADSRPGMEIAWRLMPEAWGNGYATEAAEACLLYARQELGLTEIYSFAPKVNKRSVRVMQKLGMLPLKEFDHPAIPTGHALARHIIYCTVMPDAKKRGVIDVGEALTATRECDSVVLFVNGYWNTGRKAMRLGSVFFNRLGVEMRDAIVENIGDVPLQGYWEEEFIDKALDYFRTRFKNIDG